MTWTRLDDSWTERRDLADLPHADRWHYLGMIQFCSRTDNRRGILRAVDANRASDHPDPARAVANLVAAGLLEKLPDGRVQIREIAEHLPTEAVIRRAEQNKIRQRRKRAHAAGDHSLCLPENCEDAASASEGLSRTVAPESRGCHAPVTRDVTQFVGGDVGTGRDGTGLDYRGSSFGASESVTDWETVTPGQGTGQARGWTDERAQIAEQTAGVFGTGLRAVG
ncbi:hypothetical protein DEU33_1279 [Kocuria sp. AG109]|nr:hypothetical protein DEU33_1279 [Kocuria sp. AG109]